MMGRAHKLQTEMTLPLILQPAALANCTIYSSQIASVHAHTDTQPPPPINYTITQMLAPATCEWTDFIF